MYLKSFILCSLILVNNAQNIFNKVDNEVSKCPLNSYENQAQIIQHFIVLYYEEQKAVKIFRLTNYRCEAILAILFSQKSILTYESQEFNYKQPIFKQNFGFFTITNELKRDFIASLNEISTSGLWLVKVYKDFNEGLLKVAWDEYQILHLVILAFDEKMKCFNAIYYNPFTNVLHKDALVNERDVEKSIFVIFQRTRNLKGYRLNVYISSAIKTYATPMYDAKGKIYRYRGIDGEILEGIRHAMNFRVKWSKVMFQNLTYSELLMGLNDAIAKRKIDLIAVQFAIKYSRLVDVYPLNYQRPTTALCAVHTNREPYMIGFLYGFADDLTTFILYFSAFFLAFSFFIVTIVLKFPFLKPNFAKACVETLGILTGNSRRMINYTPVSLRMTITFAFFLNCFVSSMYQASIYDDLNHESKFTQINTVEQLVRKNVTVIAYDDFYQIIQGFKNDTKARMELKNHILLNDDKFLNDQFVKEIASNTSKRNYGIIMFKYQALLFRALSLDRQTARTAIHIVNEPIILMTMAFHVPSYSPFLDTMDEMAGRLFEAGLRQKAQNDAIYITMLARLQIVKKFEMEGGVKRKKPQPIAYENLTEIFLMYFGGIGIAMISFIIENISYRFECKVVRKK